MDGWAEKTLVIATHNGGKLNEFAHLMAPYGFKVISAGELGLPEPEETGTSFEENAQLKALAALAATGLPVLADDSGLCVDALGGAPGVYTADWATQPDGSRDFSRAMQKVEKALVAKGASEPQHRKARFVAVLCLARPGGQDGGEGEPVVEFFRGEVEGQMVWPPRGEQGFGYDPVFLPDGFDRTFGEMEASEKHGWEAGRGDLGLSHRARAFAKFAQAKLQAKPGM